MDNQDQDYTEEGAGSVFNNLGNCQRKLSRELVADGFLGRWI